MPIIRRVNCIGKTSGICYLHRVKYTRCRIDTINSSDDGYIAVRNMLKIEINIHEKELCVKLVICKDYNEIHGQQNIK